MATVNLGSIKFKWQGAYNGATAYTVDDVVSYNGSSYICIANSTGNLPTDTSYFEQMSAKGTDGTNGTNGTDLSTTLTTQGDLVYRDGSGLQRLGAGTAGQVLQTGGAGANPSWGTISSDYVKLSTITPAANTTSSITFDNLFDDSIYLYYVCAWNNVSLHSGAAQGMKFRFLDSTGSELSGAFYRGGSMAHYITSSTSTNNLTRNWSSTELSMFADNISLTSSNNRGWTGCIRISQPESTVHKTEVQGNCTGDNGGGESFWDASFGGYYQDGNYIVNRGFKIFGTNGYTFADGSQWVLYGVKK